MSSKIAVLWKAFLTIAIYVPGGAALTERTAGLVFAGCRITLW